jgi:hypothetical protein
VHSALIRGRQEEADRLREQHADELLTAQRIAWSEGHTVGVAVGRSELLTRIDARYGKYVRARRSACMEVLKRMADDPRKVTKADLERALDNAVDMLGELVEAHHHGFAEDGEALPF